MDLDGDGNSDILSGSYSRMSQPMAGLFQVLWGKPDGTFKAAATLNGTDNEPLIIPTPNAEAWVENICTRPTAVDWDADGDLDLVVGNFPGTFYLFTGEGGGRFSVQATQIMAGDSPLKIDGVHSDPFVVDWDGDGDLDLLSGSSNGGVAWSENTAGKGKTPKLKPFQKLIPPSPPAGDGMFLAESDLKGPAQCTRIYADDVNADGKLDLLVGDLVTLVSRAEGVSKDEFPKKLADWQVAFRAVSAKASETTDAAERTKVYQELSELYQQRSKFMLEERTGYVWLFLRK